MNAYSTKKVELAIKKLIHYYQFFNYSPSFDLIYLFFPYQIVKKELQNSLNKLIKRKKLISYCLTHPMIPSREGITLKKVHPEEIKEVCFPIASPLYTLPQYTIRKFRIQNLELGIKNTNRLLEKVKPYIQLLQKMSFIQMVGITGSASMGNCKKNDDIDLCIITKSKSLWITRFLCVVLAKLMGLYGKYVCLNLFFDESDLIIPQQKQTIYIGHELLQMKLIINKGKTYERMLFSNPWVFSQFPNARSRLSLRGVKRRSNPVEIATLSRHSGIVRNDTNLLSIIYYLLSPFEALFKFIQLPLIRKNKTALLITPTQLWLFKRDFEARLPQKIKRLV